MENYHIAVFDIGKTNKKLLIYDPGLNILKIEKVKIEEFSDGHLKHDNIGEIERWITECLRNNASEFNIKAISISIYDRSR
jgi:sugar (pentulose or hexulose) kinase